MRQTPLYPEYGRHGAKVVDFHGWALPVQFSGILDEHRQTRSKAGLFDCSHMGEFLLQGEEAIAAFNGLVFIDVFRLKVGRCRYTAILNAQGGIIDDCVAMRLAEDELYVVTNAGPLEEVAALIGEDRPGVAHVTAETAKIDLQGPRSRDILLEFGLDAIAPLKFWQVTRAAWQGHPMVIARAGYTGELGYELYMPNEAAAPVWRLLSGHPEVAPCGLGARDTLRLEMGYPLNGEDLTPATTPLEAGMTRFLSWETPFPGKEAVARQREQGDYPRLTPIVSPNRRAPRHGFELKRDGEVAGHVTSGTFGPSVGHGVGLAMIAPPHCEPGVQFEAGPRGMAVESAEIPVYKKGTCRKKVH